LGGDPATGVRTGPLRRRRGTVRRRGVGRGPCGPDPADRAHPAADRSAGTGRPPGHSRVVRRRLTRALTTTTAPAATGHHIAALVPTRSDTHPVIADDPA